MQRSAPVQQLEWKHVQGSLFCNRFSLTVDLSTVYAFLYSITLDHMLPSWLIYTFDKFVIPAAQLLPASFCCLFLQPWNGSEAWWRPGSHLPCHLQPSSPPYLPGWSSFFWHIQYHPTLLTWHIDVLGGGAAKRHLAAAYWAKQSNILYRRRPALRSRREKVYNGNDGFIFQSPTIKNVSFAEDQSVGVWVC